LLVPLAAFGDLKVKPLRGQIENKAASGGPETTGSDLERNRIELERERFEFDKQLEQKRLAVEQLKAWLSGASILIAVLIGVLMVHYALKQQEKRARSLFELKAIEIVMSSNNAADMVSKAKTLRTLFPERLSEEFTRSIETLTAST